ncbi:LOW QUALITY PROTEIN: beta-galactosidase-1-like protein 2 [Pollicipes pollicipes]|uniref:LOW QUALITY PROTEIN: beta-galactosidase-1-like protein 2 n=1 Tax=Pollicipes pollicipes TaxID=41117 RepID=UPI0018850BBD|nr:LOW QUALITY PROTEIN: beta-galactosidase-1-like protein 2 [Pollicipes pollicipes]
MEGRRRAGSAADLVNWYDYYAAGGQRSEGLVASGEHFTLNGLEVQVFSGAVHYFRVHPAYWRATLRKLRAAGLNTVETYVAWNLHEPQRDVYDFGDGGGDMSEFLDLAGYLKIAQEEDLFVILRPGPYICSEWDFGGLPSYLLGQYNVHVRSADDFYMARVEKWLSQLLPKVTELQFTKGGPIIAVQVENEFGAFGYSDFPRDRRYLDQVKQLLEQHGITELLFTSDSPANSGDMGSLPGVLQTANFQKDVEAQLAALRRLQPDRPLMAMEFWTGWFDHWLAPFKAGLDAAAFREILDVILQSNSSVNMYMFQGGTNFGFMAGANWVNVNPNFTPDTTSYDYDAVLTEGGCYTEKYNITKELLQKHSIIKNLKPVEQPEENPVKAYDFVQLKEAISMEVLRDQLTAERSDQLLNMENLSVNNGSGQSYGLVWYRANVTTANSSKLTIRGHVRDVALVVIDGQLLTKKPENVAALESFGYWPLKDASITLPCAAGDHVLDILVENMGRVNYGEPHVLDFQRKGLYEGPVEIDGAAVTGWEIYPMEMKKDWINKLQQWTPLGDASVALPTMLRGTLKVDEPADTYLDMRQLTKGVVFVNGFNLGRYLTAGPVFTLYLPAPLLSVGDNQIVVFEEFGTEDPVINFSTHAITLETKAVSKDWAPIYP